MKLEVVKILSLRPDPQNARKHDERNIAAIAKSLAQFGQRRNLVITHDGVVIAGNGTLEAAKQLGWTELAVDRTPKEWDEATARAYALADNQTSALSEWDDAVLNGALVELAEDGWDITALGFDPIVEPVVPDFKPTDDVSRLDQKVPKRCPECAFEWHIGAKGEVIPV